jgi:hypothetical protein
MSEATNFGPIVGCWQMTEAWDMNDPGKPGKSYPWGQPPLGYWVYDPAGNFSVMISINPALGVVTVDTSGDSSWWDVGQQLVTDMSASFDNFYAYFGTYTVDYGTGIVTHHVVADVLRAYTNTAQPRPFELTNDNNTLIIGDQTTYLRQFNRVASFGGY